MTHTAKAKAALKLKESTMNVSNPLFLLPVVGFVICTLGLMLGGGIKQIQAGNPSRLQSACLIGLGVSSGALGLFLVGKSGLGTIILLAGGVLSVVAGIFGLVKASKK
jgi:hypothetical protein